MKTETVRTLIREQAAIVRGTVWPNGLGFDTIGADGLPYSVTIDEHQTRVAIVWCAASRGRLGTGPSSLVALANVTGAAQ